MRSKNLPIALLLQKAGRYRKVIFGGAAVGEVGVLRASIWIPGAATVSCGSRISATNVRGGAGGVSFPGMIWPLTPKSAADPTVVGCCRGSTCIRGRGRQQLGVTVHPEPGILRMVEARTRKSLQHRRGRRRRSNLASLLTLQLLLLLLVGREVLDHP